ncbi:MAG: NAD(P)/FAD-dependent oxidoreductase [Ruminococcus sp.]|jgi:glycerol-3-phosphate dehydrogenase
MTQAYDVLIVGAGVIGCTVSRELSRYQLSVCVVEKGPDICMETSNRNSAVLHAGYNNRPDSLMAKFCVEGNRTFDQVAAELDIPYKRTGKLVVGFTADDLKNLRGLKEQGEKNGIKGIEIVNRDFIDRKAPLIKGNFAMWSPTTAILSPFQFTYGMAENAADNGVSFFCDCEVTGISLRPDGIHSVITKKGIFKSRWVINCAGLGSDMISSMLGINDYTLYPCRGEYFILDKKLSKMLPLPVYPVPNYQTGGLGIHLTPTLDGNIMVGPSTEYINERGNYSTTRKIMDMLIEDGSRIFPYLKREYFIRNFAGIRPKLSPKGVGGYHDFVIERRDDIDPHAVNLVGIESPGLTSAVPIAREVLRLIMEKEDLKKNPAFHPLRHRFPTFRDKSPEEQAQLIRNNSDYGEIICRCETITKAEVLHAIKGPLGASTVTGVKYRCRAMMGRCQGGYCQTRITELLMQEKEIRPEDLIYERQGSYIFTGEVRKK